MVNPEPSSANSDPGPMGDEGEIPDEERVSYAAYFGAATGLVAGLILAMLGAAWLYWARPDGDWPMMFWEISSPLLAILGFVSCGYLFHRQFRGQVVVPALIFLGLFTLGAYLAAGPVGFPWKEMTGV